MPESLKQLQDRLENYVEKIKTRRGEIQDVSSQYNFDINRTYSFNLAEIIRELTKMPDERVTKLKHFSAYAMKIFPLLTQATDQEMKRRNLQQKIDDMEKEIVAKFKRKQKQREKKKKQTDKQVEALRIGRQDSQDDSHDNLQDDLQEDLQEDTKDDSAVKMEISYPQAQ